MQQPIRWSAASAMLLCTCLALGSAVAAPACPADLDSSGIVNGIDLANLLGQWSGLASYVPCPPYRTADVNQNCIVNGIDLALLLGAWGPCPKQTMPTITYTPVAFDGEPPPGIPVPGAIYDFILTPMIDGDGNVLFQSFIAAPGMGQVGNSAIFYGQPGHINKLFWETDHAPDFPPGVTIQELAFSGEPRISEVGTVAFNAIVQGPGITPGVDDMVIYFGDPRIEGSFHKVLRAGEQAPGCEPGVTIHTCPLCVGFGMFTVSDNGTMLIVGDLAGPGVTADNDRAIWTGTPGGLHLVWRKGMHAPGTPPGVTFAWADFMSINDAGQIAFRGGLAGLGIVDGVNNSGRWIGGPDSLQVYTWTGMPAPGLPPGTTFTTAGGGLTCTNNPGDMYAVTLVTGPRVTPLNDLALHIGQPGALQLCAHEGDAAPGTEDGVTIASIGNVFINDLREVFFRIKFAGSSIDASNEWAMYYGAPGQAGIALRDGNPAPQFPAGVVLSRVVAAMSLSALNDVGDVLTVTEIAGPSITAADKVVLWRRDAARQQWYPLLRGNDVILGRMVAIPTTITLSGAYWQATGGSDGRGLSFNDGGQLTLALEFTDGARGSFVISAK